MHKQGEVSAIRKCRRFDTGRKREDKRDTAGELR
jgi:hypothetical protein